MLRASMSRGADMKANTLGAAAHLSSEILVSLRTAASAEAPWSPILLTPSLWMKGGAGMVREQECQRALTQKQTLGRWFECPSSLLERLQGRIALEALGERRGALVSDAVASEPVNERWSGDGERSGVSRGADIKANTREVVLDLWRTRAWRSSSP